MEAAKGNDGWVVLLVKDEKRRAEVVGKVNAKGMFSHAGWRVDNMDNSSTKFEVLPLSHAFSRPSPSGRAECRIHAPKRQMNSLFTVPTLRSS